MRHTILDHIKAEEQLKAYGTSEGVRKAWESRKRGKVPEEDERRGHGYAKEEGQMIRVAPHLQDIGGRRAKVVDLSHQGFAIVQVGGRDYSVHRSDTYPLKERRQPTRYGRMARL